MAVVVAHLGERLLPTPEVRGSNPVTGKLIFCQLYWKNEKSRKRDWERSIFLKTFLLYNLRFLKLLTNFCFFVSQSITPDGSIVPNKFSHTTYNFQTGYFCNNFHQNLLDIILDFEGYGELLTSNYSVLILYAEVVSTQIFLTSRPILGRASALWVTEYNAKV